MRKQLHNSLILTVHNVMRFLTPVLLFWLISTVGDEAVAGSITNVYCPIPAGDGDQCGTLNIMNYYAWQSSVTGKFAPRDPSDPRLGLLNASRGGARMRAVFNISDQSQAGNYAWIQAIVGGNSTIGTPPYIDPFVNDDTLPFYWTESELPAFTKKHSIELLDLPNQRLTNAKQRLPNGKFNPVSVQFETALVWWEDMTIQLLQSFTWGYTITYNIIGYKATAEPFAWTLPSTEFMDLITSFDGNGDGEADGWTLSEKTPTITSFDGDGYADGWTLSEKSPTIPAPPSSMLLLLGLISIWLMKNRIAVRREIVSGLYEGWM